MIVFIIDFVVSSLQIKNIGYVIKKISSNNIFNMYVKIFNNIPISNINLKSIVLLYFVHIYIYIHNKIINNITYNPESIVFQKTCEKNEIVISKRKKTIKLASNSVCLSYFYSQVICNKIC